VLVGHYAMSLLAKRIEPRISLGTLVLAAMVPDLLWPNFTAAGLERVNFGTGLGAGNYFQAIDIALSHSLLTGALWAGVLGMIYFLLRRSARGAWLLVALVLSHWVLDVVTHRPDMPLAPAVPLTVGFGLWTSIPATLLVEGGLWLGAVIVYARTTQATSRAGALAFWIAVPLLTLIWYNNIAGPPPNNPESAPAAAIVLFSIVVVWAYWVNRLRTPTIPES